MQVTKYLHEDWTREFPLSLPLALLLSLPLSVLLYLSLSRLLSLLLCLLIPSVSLPISFPLIPAATLSLCPSPSFALSVYLSFPLSPLYADCTVLLSFPSCPVKPALFRQSCQSCPVQAALSWLSCVMTRHSCSGSPVLRVLFWLSCPGYPVLAVLSWLSFPGCPFLAVLFRLSSSLLYRGNISFCNVKKRRVITACYILLWCVNLLQILIQRRVAFFLLYNTATSQNSPLNMLRCVNPRDCTTKRKDKLSSGESNYTVVSQIKIFRDTLLGLKWTIKQEATYGQRWAEDR